MFGETTISYVKVWNHPIETTIYKWLFGVPGRNSFRETPAKRRSLCCTGLATPESYYLGPSPQPYPSLGSEFWQSEKNTYNVAICSCCSYIVTPPPTIYLEAFYMGITHGSVQIYIFNISRRRWINNKKLIIISDHIEMKMTPVIISLIIMYFWRINGQDASRDSSRGHVDRGADPTTRYQMLVKLLMLQKSGYKSTTLTCS